VKRIIPKATAALLLICLLVPTTDIVCPDWEVLVTDTEGHPIGGAEVTASSQQYTVEGHDTEVTKITGEDGRVHFDQRRFHMIGLIGILGVIRNILAQGAHASFGVHTWVAASKDGYGDPTKLDLFIQNDRASHANGAAKQSSHIVLLKCPPGYRGMGCDFPINPDDPVLPFQK
jgi:hypothetical protein